MGGVVGDYGSDMSRQLPTIRTVAERAGVSTATVSYVLSGRSGGVRTRVSDETRDRVVIAAEELGYVPNQSARGMRRGRTDQVCLVLRHCDTPWARAMAETVTAAMDGHRLSTFLLVGGDWEGFLLRRGADAAFVDLAGNRGVAAAGLRRIVDRDVSLVVMNERLEPDGFDVVRANEAEACDSAMRMLLAGHRRIAWLGGYPDDPPGRVSDRFGSYRRGLAEAGIGFDDDLVRFTGTSRELAYREAVSLLDRPEGERPSAVFAASDLAAISALWAAQRLGVDVPDGLAVVGVGNSPEGVLVDPPLTSVGPEAVFSAVADLLLTRLRGEAPEAGRLYEARWTLHRRGTA